MNSVDPTINRRIKRRTRLTVYGLSVVTALALTGAGCGFIKPEQLHMLEPTELHQAMEASDILLIDVHSPEQKHIPGTDYYVPFYRIGSHLDKFPADKNTPIYLYCKSGPMGNWAARSLLSHGYTTIYNLEGGIEAWLKAGMPKPTP